MRRPYPGYDVMAKRDSPSWNDQTRVVIDRRLHQVPERQFFKPDEWSVLQALCVCVMPQPDRKTPIPIAPWIDAALAEGRGNGTRFANLPPAPEAWRKGLRAIDAEAMTRRGAPFAELDPRARQDVVSTIDKGHARAPEWGDLPPRDFLRKLALQEIVRIYYAHPDAMSEIGFGGPASPRGYVRLKANRADPWEAGFGRWEPL